MNGFERLKTMLDEWIEKNGKDTALIEVVDYLLNRVDLENNYLNLDKTVDGLYDFRHSKGRKHFNNGWRFIINEVVFSWAVMYFSLPNKFLKINTSKSSNSSKIDNKSSKTTQSNNNVVSLEDAKKKLEKKKETEQLSLFGGVV